VVANRSSSRWNSFAILNEVGNLPLPLLATAGSSAAGAGPSGKIRRDHTTGGGWHGWGAKAKSSAVGGGSHGAVDNQQAEES
jgi:hypothetical protein